ncbi:hypothetical protein ACEN9D_01795 [Pseudomonas sp. CT11-2]|uniref:hypothetical protein n=1 Tax=Pseudomonas sp. CT11-2 TaxID=3243023 RepID=UPI0039B09E58
MSVDSRSRVAISKFFANPAGSIILTLVSVLSAGYISICSSPILMQCQAILGTLPKETPPPDTYIHSIVALALAVFALLMVWLRERGLADMAIRKEERLEALAVEREGLIKSENTAMEGRLTNLPPRQFMNDYVQTLREIGELRRLTKNEIASLTPEMIIKRVQTMMSGVLSLARTWDDISASHKFVSYHANIMRIFSSDEIALSPVVDLALDQATTDDEGKNGGDKNAALDAAEDDRSLENWILQYEFFLHNQSYNVAIERCSGILFIQDVELSVESLHPDKADENVEQICLPFTYKQDYKCAYHHPNLPGAPQSAASGQPIYISDVQATIAKWFTIEKRRDKEISPRYEEEITQYFQNLEHAKSLISLPIYHNEKLMGVLNVSRNVEDMLMNSDRAELFVQLMNPVCYHLGKMLASLEDRYSSQDGVIEASEVDDEN